MAEPLINKIARHIKKNEKPVHHPYLDTTGHVTIGAGFKADNENAFTALDLQTAGGRPATTDEKKQAFRQMQAKRESRKGNFEAGAGAYKDSTSIRMSDDAIENKLEQDLPAWVERTKAEVGGKAWDRLSDEQKTALTDTAYANGSLAKFPKLKEAARKGDAAAMARESHFFGGRDKNGKPHRNWGRIKANHCAMQGLDSSGDACKRSVLEHYKGTGEKPRFLGDAVNVAGTGSVHVRAYARDGGKTSVSAYDRSRPGG